MGAPINIDNPECDVYKIGSAWNDAYKISTVKMCYPGDGTVEAKFILGEAIDNIEFTYLKGLYPSAEFSMPSMYDNTPVQVNKEKRLLSYISIPNEDHKV